MQGLNWDDLQAFLAVARAGHITRAGAVLGMDATTVSRRLRRLEAQLGTTLFERTREGQALTEAGDRLLVQVEEMARAVSGIVDGAHAPGMSGTLRISVSEGFGSGFLARHLPDFAAAHPALTIDLVASSGFLSLSKREADIAVMLSRPRAGPVIARKLSDYALRLYASEDYLARHGAPAAPAELSRHRLVGYIPDLLYAPELRYLDEFAPGLVPALRSSSINAQQQLLTAGAGIGVLPCFIGDMGPNLVRVLPEFSILRTFWLVTHKDTHMLGRIKAGKEWIAAVAHRYRQTLVPN